MSTQTPLNAREDGVLLLVDADPVTRRQSAETLRAAGFRIREARTGFEALNLLYGCAPRLLILDLELPELTGAELLALADAEHILPPVVVMRAGPVDGRTNLCRLPNVVGTLRKPIFPEETGALLAFSSSEAAPLGEHGVTTRLFALLSAADVPDNAQKTFAEVFLHGGTSREIAKRLGIAIPTVRNHLRRANRALGAASRDEALELVERGIYAHPLAAVRPAQHDREATR